MDSMNFWHSFIYHPSNPLRRIWAGYAWNLQACMVIRRLMRGYTHLYLSTFYLLCIVLFLRSDRDDDMDQDRGNAVYNIG